MLRSGWSSSIKKVKNPSSCLKVFQHLQQKQTRSSKTTGQETVWHLLSARLKTKRKIALKLKKHSTTMHFKTVPVYLSIKVWWKRCQTLLATSIPKKTTRTIKSLYKVRKLITHLNCKQSSSCKNQMIQRTWRQRRKLFSLRGPTLRTISLLTERVRAGMARNSSVHQR